MDTNLLKQKITVAFSDFENAIWEHTDINTKRADGGWSVGEIADHILKSTLTDFGATKKTERAYDQNAASIKDLFLNFELKFQAAPILEPEKKSYNSKELFSQLEENKARILNMIEEQDLTETCVDIELPGWGALTKFEWLVLMENHIIRHTKQINDFDKATA
jgi:hypothetical protein